MSYLTHETMDQMSRDYDEDAAHLLNGMWEAERYVSEFDMELADCIHPVTVEFPTVDLCTDCGIEVAR